MYYIFVQHLTQTKTRKVMKTKTTIKVPSKREYQLFFSETDKSAIHSLQDILQYSLNEDYEWAHALVDKLDDILDLQIAQCMFFYPNRDDKNIRREHGIIKRIR